MVLRKWQREEIFDAVVAAGRDSGFAIDDGDDQCRVRHLLTGSYFTVSGAAGNYTVRYVAGDGPVEDRDRLSWYGLTESVKLWRSEVDRYFEMPDRWAELRQAQEMLFAVSSEGIDNRRFSAEEQAAIEHHLREFRERARDRWPLSGERLAALDAKVDYLIDAVRRLGRLDWRNVAITTFISLVVAVFPSEPVSDVVKMLLRDVGPVLGH